MTRREKLVAILCADVAGYTRLMADDQKATVDTLSSYRNVFARHIQEHDGRLVDSTGDALLAEFGTAAAAARCALDVQHELARLNASLSDHRRMRFRVGVNLGDVTEQEGALYGDGINIASRLESLCQPGGICISGSVYDQVHGKLPVRFQYAGEHSLKNLPKPVRVFHVAVNDGQTKPSALHLPWRRRRWWALGAGGVMLALISAIAWHFSTSMNRDGVLTDESFLAMPRGPTIAVLPFTNMSGDPSQDYLTDGLTEDIITELARFRELNVLARHTTFQFKGKNMDVASTGRKLGARYVIEGSMRKTDVRLRVTAQLIDVQTGAHVWADKYDRALEDIFAVQDEIANKIAATVAGGSGGVIMRAGKEHSDTKPPTELRAYDYVLRAMPDVPGAPEDQASEIRKLGYLKKAIELDPTYGRARAEYAHRLMTNWAFLLDRSVPLEEITRQAEEAVRLDTAEPWAHLTLAFAYYFSKRLELFAREARAALELGPNDAEALAMLGALYTFSGQWEAGVRIVGKANTLSPISAAGWYHSALHYDYFRRRQFKEAVDIIAMHPGQEQVETQWKYVAAYGAMGNRERAVQHWNKCLQLDPQWSKGKLRERLQMWNFPESFIRSYLAAHDVAGL